jgi:hypothetical protein
METREFETELTKGKRNRENEKGAAMVMVLLLSMLLLVASAGILLETSLNTANVTDSTAEQQAYNAAESGIQSAINVLRGNVPPSPLLNPSGSKTDLSNRIDFRKAVTLKSSNIESDWGSDQPLRLSRWLNYGYRPARGEPRVTLGVSDPRDYNPYDGYAFSLSLSDPDNTGRIISYRTEGGFYDSKQTPRWRQEITLGTSPNTARLVYVPSGLVNNLDVSSGTANTNFGRFLIGPAAGPVVISEPIRFQIIVTMKAPYTTSRIIRGFVKAGTYAANGSVDIDFDSLEYEVMGSRIKLDADPLKAAIGGLTTVSGTMSQAEPYRLVIRSTGYGPRGAVKILEATIQKNFFNGMSAPATLTLIGGPGAGFLFDAGTSQQVTYSGQDVVAPNVIIPPIGTTNDDNLDKVLANLSGRGHKADVIGYPANIEAELPFWLQSTQNLDQTVRALKTVADASGRYYKNVEPSDIGNNANATGITFVDGDLSIRQDGGGILIVTGKLTLHGAFKFNGLIIVTGSGGVDRRGGGNGVIQGNVVVAPYNPDRLNDGFLMPKYDMSGGGNSEMVYNSSSVGNGMTAVSNFVLGVAEK